MLVKKESSRLKNKNWRYYKGKPMYQWNLEKCLLVFDEVFVSSDDDKILEKAKEVGAFELRRPKELLEATNIDCYKYIMKFTDADAFVAIQANSPELSVRKIKWAKDLLQLGHNEIKTCHEDKTDYGSIWGMTKERLKDYSDPYKANPSFWIIDKSIDIHFIEDIYKSYEESKNYRRSWPQFQRKYPFGKTDDRRSENDWSGYN